jgi:hypothetical protein
LFNFKYRIFGQIGLKVGNWGPRSCAASKLLTAVQLDVGALDMRHHEMVGLQNGLRWPSPKALWRWVTRLVLGGTHLLA